MDRASELRSIVAGFLEVEATSIGPATDLGGPGLSTSLKRAGLDAALRRRLGVRHQAVYTARRFGELELAVCGGEAATAGADDQPGSPVVSAPAAGASGRVEHGAASAGARCGIDIEQVDAFPEASDYWEHELYRTHFTDAEIAYCSAQSRPREHFAARWAAKEAVRKLGPEYLGVESRDLEVARDDDGSPRMTLQGAPLPVSVSMTHAGPVAVAVAVSMPQVKPAASDRPPDSVRSEPKPGSRAARRPSRLSRLWRLMLPLATIVALVAAIWALLRTFA